MVEGCESTGRFEVTVVINDPEAPTGSAVQTFCTGTNPTVANLIAIGTSIKWYSVSSGGTVLAEIEASCQRESLFCVTDNYQL